MKSQLEEYFRKFIIDVQGLAVGSANHYDRNRNGSSVCR